MTVCRIASRNFWIIVAAILVISVGVTLLFALKLQREREVWEMNPPALHHAA